MGQFTKKRYVRTGNLDPNLDIKTYDFGSLTIAVGN